MTSFQFLGNNAASINIKKARFFTKNIFLKTALYVLDTRPEPKPQLVKSWNRNRNRNKQLRFRNTDLMESVFASLIFSPRYYLQYIFLIVHRPDLGQWFNNVLQVRPNPSSVIPYICCTRLCYAAFQYWLYACHICTHLKVETLAYEKNVGAFRQTAPHQ